MRSEAPRSRSSAPYHARTDRRDPQWAELLHCGDRRDPQMKDLASGARPHGDIQHGGCRPTTLTWGVAALDDSPADDRGRSALVGRGAQLARQGESVPSTLDDRAGGEHAQRRGAPVRLDATAASRSSGRLRGCRTSTSRSSGTTASSSRPRLARRRCPLQADVPRRRLGDSRPRSSRRSCTSSSSGKFADFPAGDVHYPGSCWRRAADAVLRLVAHGSSLSSVGEHSVSSRRSTSRDHLPLAAVLVPMVDLVVGLPVLMVADVGLRHLAGWPEFSLRRSFCSRW